MSVRVNADADKASRSTALPPSNNITFFCYAKLLSNLGTDTPVFSLDDGNVFQTLEAAGGNVLPLADGFANSVAGAAMTVGHWYAIGYSSNGTTGKLWMKDL